MKLNRPNGDNNNHNANNNIKTTINKFCCTQIDLEADVHMKKFVALHF